MMRVAGGSHGQTSNLRILEGITIVAAQRSRCVENLDRIHRQRFQNGKTDSGPEQIVRMWRNGETAALMNDVADFPRRFSLQIRQLRTDAEKMTIGGGHFHSRQKQGTTHGASNPPQQTLL